MKSIAIESVINMKNLQNKKKRRSIPKAVYTLLPNLNFNRQTPTIVTHFWKETLIEKNKKYIAT